MGKAVAVLQAGCKTAAACADKTCADAMKVVLMAHDVCDEKDLPNNLEVALHDYEEPCEAQLCNSAPAAFNPYDKVCSNIPGSRTSAARGFGSQAAFLVTALAL